jgi:hypothetical protein
MEAVDCGVIGAGMSRLLIAPTRVDAIREATRTS